MENLFNIILKKDLLSLNLILFYLSLLTKILRNTLLSIKGVIDSLKLIFLFNKKLHVSPYIIFSAV